MVGVRADRGSGDHGADVSRDQPVDPCARRAGDARDPDRARARAVGSCRSRPGRLHVPRVRPELRPRPYRRRRRPRARRRVQRSGSDRLGGGRAARRGDRESAQEHAAGDPLLDRDHRHAADRRVLGPDRRLGRQRHEGPDRLGDASRVRAGSEVLGRRLAGDARRDAELHDRGVGRLPERGDENVVRHGPSGSSAEDRRPRAPDAEDPGRRRSSSSS